MQAPIQVQTNIKASLEQVWNCFTQPRHICGWNFAAIEWCCPSAINDLAVGKQFNYRMEAVDGSMGFNLIGTYTKIIPFQQINYTLSDGRSVSIHFNKQDVNIELTEIFEPEEMHSPDFQKAGWQAILNHFKIYTEKQAKKIQHSIRIKATASKVYQLLQQDVYYKQWTAPFNPTSHFIGSWEKGAVIRFIGSDADGKVGGMLSRIVENIPNSIISIEHIGIIQGTEEITEGPSVQGWKGSIETYIFTPIEHETLFILEMDSHDEYADYFNETWPKALLVLKQICESN
jgi:uncharacterized protein YndB with AHSA1/START domain